MNWNVIEGNWAQYKGQVKAQWGKLSNDNLDIIAGKRDQLLGQIQKSYGIAQEEAEQQIAAFQKFLSESRRP
ncbi:MAG: CsbD family protein [Herbaspirillum sp.]